MFAFKSVLYAFVLLTGFLLFGIFTTVLPVSAQTEVGFGGWRSYVSHRKGVSLAVRKTEVVMASDVGIVYFDAQKGQYHEFTRTDGLSGSEPELVYYDAVHDLFLIAYANGLVDYIRDFSDLKKNIASYRDIFQTRNFATKKINGMFGFGRYVYFATDFGIVAWDVERKETRYTYTKIGESPAESKVNAVAVFQGRLYALTEERGLWSASLSSPNLADGRAWRIESGDRNLTSINHTLLTANSSFIAINGGAQLFVMSGKDTTWKVVADTNYVIKKWVNLQATPAGLVISEDYFSVLYDLNTGSFERLPVMDNHKVTLVSEDQRIVALSSSQYGLLVLNRQNRDTLLVMKGGIPNNLCSDIAVENRQLYVGPSSENNGAPSYDKSGVYYMDLTQRKWVVLDRYNGGLDPEKCSDSNGYLYFSPQNDRVYVAAWNCGLNVIERGRLVNIWDKDNSCLTGYGGSRKDNIRVKGIVTDSKGNLWATTNAGIEPIAVITPKGDCYSYPVIPNVVNQLWTMTVDPTDNLWIINRKEGIVVYNQKGTLDNPDYSYRVLRSGVGNGNLPSDDVNSMAVDLDGVMWVGTAAGVCAFYNPSAVLSSSKAPDAIAPIYQGRYLLKDERINKIVIDGANRKWFGTNQNGVYLFNADCTEQLAHFTAENSPLLSDRIYDIEVDDASGEIFFATQRGIVSYQDIVTAGGENNDNISVFPNPYYTDHTLPLVIRGTVDKAVVKITSVSGLLVKELQSQGGQALWDGKDITGKSVRSGVYLIFVTNDEGKSPNVAKLTVLSRE